MTLKITVIAEGSLSKKNNVECFKWYDFKVSNNQNSIKMLQKNPIHLLTNVIEERHKSMHIYSTEP